MKIENGKKNVYYLFRNDRIYFKIGRDKQDVEKCVIPAILFINTNNKEFGENAHRGFVICFGWWDYSLKIGLFY